MAITEVQRMELAHWMGWGKRHNPSIGTWYHLAGKPSESCEYVDKWLNPPTWYHAGLLMEQALKEDLHVIIEGIENEWYCTLIRHIESAPYSDDPTQAVEYNGEGGPFAEAVATAILAMLDARQATGDNP
jgi:hypothetical protein